MKHKIFSVYDSKAKAYLPPFFLHEEGMAIRGFTTAVNDKSHAFGQYPADYTLFNIGAFDDATAQIIHQDPISLGNGIEFVQKSTEEAQSSLFEESA